MSDSVAVLYASHGEDPPETTILGVFASKERAEQVKVDIVERHSRYWLAVTECQKACVRGPVSIGILLDVEQPAWLPSGQRQLLQSRSQQVRTFGANREADRAV